MKKLFYYATSILMLFLLIVGCKSKDNKDDMSKNMKETTAVSDEEQRKMNADYKEFKLKAYDDIKENERKIDKLIVNIAKSDSSFTDSRGRGIIILKKKNNKLRDRLYSYNLDTSNWSQFKTDFNSEMNNVSDTFRDLFAKN